MRSFLLQIMKVNIIGKLQDQWQASTRPNSQKAMAENVAGFVDITKIGEEYEEKCSLKLIT